MKEIYELNQMEIERQNDLIKKYKYEKERLMNRIASLDSTIDRKKRIIIRKETENKFMIKNNLV